MRVLRPGPPACGARARVAGERERCGVCGHAPLVTTNPAPLVHSLRLLRRLPTLLGAQRGLPPAANVGPVPGECAWPPDPAPLLCSLLTLSPCCLCWDACTSGALSPQRERRREGTATRDWPLPRGGAGLPRSAPSRCKVLPRAHAPNAPPRATVPRQSRRAPCVALTPSTGGRRRSRLRRGGAGSRAGAPIRGDRSLLIVGARPGFCPFSGSRHWFSGLGL